jgi:hypothetical protein
MAEPVVGHKDLPETGGSPLPAPAALAPGRTPFGSRVLGRSVVGPVADRGRRLIWLSIVVVEALLVQSFALVALYAGASAFTTMVAQALTSPFQSVFGITSVSAHPLAW